LNIIVIKEPDANTVDVTAGVLNALDGIEGLPPDIEIVTLQNDGPEVEKQLSGLLREGLLGLLLAVSVVFVFLINTRPTLLRGMALTLRPTVIIGVSIPLSILTGVLVMGAVGLSLNFMSLAGLAIAVGRVVDDSIVVLENMYRHIQRGEARMAAAVDGTREVGTAILSSTLTTVVVFVPLAFIQGLVGEFFTPFAMSVSFALLSSTLVALTAVPVLGVIFMREGDFTGESTDGGRGGAETMLQRIYTPVLIWVLAHKVATMLTAVIVTGASLFLTLVVPITFFPAGAPQYITIDVELPTGASIGRTFAQVLRIEEALQEFQEQGYVEVYQVTLGSSANEFGPGALTGGFHIAGFFLQMAEDVPRDIAERIRSHPNLAGTASEGVPVNGNEISAGPPTDALELTITGGDYTAIAAVAKDLETRLQGIEGLVNIKSDVTDARNEVTIAVNPQAAAEFDLSAEQVGHQINQFIAGRTVTEVDLEGVTVDVVVRGRPEDADDVEKLKNLNIEGRLGLAKLGSISDISIEQGPVSISRFDLERSASITGDITAENTQAVGNQVQRTIDAVVLPPGVSVRSGGIFQQIEEGFQDVFSAIAIGVILVYLVMVASLGSLRDPFIIVLNLPLAIVGALVALAITDRTLSLSALMGFLLLIGVVVTNAIVLLTFVDQLRNAGMGVYDALIEGGRTRVRPILMTAFTTLIALVPLAVSSDDEGGIIGAELATVVIGGLVSSTFLTLLAVPVLYSWLHASLPALFSRWSGEGIPLENRG
jgi:HAE1 family hydrophobic/amphiphilic exporter-1